MSQDCNYHQSVMPSEVIEALAVKPTGFYVDCTLGGGGHSSLILSQLQEGGRLLSLDRDLNAIAYASQVLVKVDSKGEYQVVHAEFADLKQVIKSQQLPLIDGILIDLGVSSEQLDNAERGFSYRFDGPLDMRMNNQQALDCSRVVNTYSENELVRILKDYGEEKFASRIAKRIVQSRPLRTTGELVAAVEKAMPAKSRREKHPAKRTFQALRIEVNGELKQLETLLASLPGLMNKGGRVVFLTFHSLEDRLVKHCFRKWEDPCICPKHLPCACGLKPLGKSIYRKGLTAEQTELANNRRSHSARLRAFVFED